MIYRWLKLTYIYDNSLAEVMVVRYWMEVVLAGVLGVLVDSFLLMPADFWQRSKGGKS